MFNVISGRTGEAEREVPRRVRKAASEWGPHPRHLTRSRFAAACGATPDEVFFGRADAVEPSLVEARRAARAERIAYNRALECRRCHPLEPPTVVKKAQEAA